MPMLKSRSLTVASALLCAMLSFGARGAAAAEQIITPDQASVTAGASQTFTIQVSYSTANAVKETLTGLGLRFHDLAIVRPVQFPRGEA